MDRLTLIALCALFTLFSSPLLASCDAVDGESWNQLVKQTRAALPPPPEGWVILDTKLELVADCDGELRLRTLYQRIEGMAERTEALRHAFAPTAEERAQIATQQAEQNRLTQRLLSLSTVDNAEELRQIEQELAALVAAGKALNSDISRRGEAISAKATADIEAEVTLVLHATQLELVNVRSSTVTAGATAAFRSTKKAGMVEQWLLWGRWSITLSEDGARARLPEGEAASSTANIALLIRADSSRIDAFSTGLDSAALKQLGH